MKKTKKFIAVLAIVMLAVSCVTAFAACGGAVRTDTYQSQPMVHYYHPTPTGRHAMVTESFTVDLYDDGTYFCAINISICTIKNLDFGDDCIPPIQNSIAITREGTYELTLEESTGIFTMVLGQATHLTYASNADIEQGFGRPYLPSDGRDYFDSDDEEATAAFETELWGDWSQFESLVGAEATLYGESSTKLFAFGYSVFDFVAPNDPDYTSKL